MIKKTKKPTNTMRFSTAVMSIRTNMEVLSNVSMVSNTKDGSDITKRKRENVNISARIARRSENNEGM